MGKRRFYGPRETSAQSDHVLVCFFLGSRLCGEVSKTMEGLWLS